MRELSFVGLSDDASHLLLTGADGSSYSLPLDARLTAVLRRDRPQPGRQETPVEPLRPKDVQARIRGGATAEEVAEESGWDLEHVRRYEGPPLAEREWIAELARGVQVRRPEGPVRLDDLVGLALEDRGVSRDALRWDSWRREDGKWTVLLAYPGEHGERMATWTYEPRGRTLLPADDEARWLVDEPTSAPIPDERPRLVGLPSVVTAARHDTIPVFRPRPVEPVEEVVTRVERVEVIERVDTVRTHPVGRGGHAVTGSDLVDDVEDGDDAGRTDTGDRGASAVAVDPQHVTSDRTAVEVAYPEHAGLEVGAGAGSGAVTDERVEASTPEPDDSHVAPTEEEDRPAATVSELPSAFMPAGPMPLGLLDDTVGQHRAPSTGGSAGTQGPPSVGDTAELTAVGQDGTGHPPVTAVPDLPEEESEPAPTPRTRPRKSRRTSVPSWDEILFGAAQRDD